MIIRDKLMMVESDINLYVLIGESSYILIRISNRFEYNVSEYILLNNSQEIDTFFSTEIRLIIYVTYSGLKRGRKILLWI